MPVRPASRPLKPIRAALLAVLLLSLAASSFAAAADDSDGASRGLVRLYEVNPFDAEGFSLFNYGAAAADLRGLSVTDGEGSIEFTSALMLEAGARLTVVTAAGPASWFTERDRTLTVGEHGIVKKGSFILGNAGDDVMLTDGASVIDAVCYGNKTAAAGWSGDPVPISSGCYILRTGLFDTDTAADWIKTRAGFSDLPFEPDAAFGCTVMPFTFPECAGAPVYEALAAAEHEVLISIYQLSSRNLVALLIELEEREGGEHVDVRVLVEGAPLGYDISGELSLLRSLADAGGEVWIVNTPEPGDYERYMYLHNKYAVIDGEKVVIASENWTTANMSASGTANRGWGAVIEGQGYAGYMASVWENDCDGSPGDVATLEERYPDLKPYGGTLTYVPPPAYDAPVCEAAVVPVLSPDNSHVALRSLMDAAEERIYAEQLSLGSSYSRLESDSPVHWMNEAAKHGVDCRFILDGYGGDVSATINLINATTGVRACSIAGGPGFGTTHNKGVLIDGDITWVGSVNWTENSFMRNREAAAVIVSAEVNAFFAGCFLADWAANTVDPGELEVTMLEGITPQGTVHLFRVDGNDSLRYIWTLDGVESGSDKPSLVRENLAPGPHLLTVSIEGTAQTVSYPFTVTPPEEDGPVADRDVLTYAVAAAIAIAAAAVAMIRRNSG